jgi:transposase
MGPLCGVTPIPASSGKTIRHRLNRGGDRHANSALHRIVLTRMSNHTETRAYVARRRTEGLNSDVTLLDVSGKFLSQFCGL